MGTSSSEHIVRLQFNALMMIVIKGALSSHRRQIARRSKHEILFCELPEMKQIEYGMSDEYSCDYVSFQVMHFVIYVADEELSTALKELTEKQRNAILLYFFQGMNDREISKLYHVSRPCYHANGTVNMQVDEELKGRIHTEMMKAILRFEIREK